MSYNIFNNTGQVKFVQPSVYVEYLDKFIKEQSIPYEAFEVLSEKITALDKICEEKPFFAIVENYSKTGAFDIEKIIKTVAKIVQKTGEDSAFYYMILSILLTSPLKAFYSKKGFTNELWEDTVAEIKRKAFECYKSYGIWGVGLGVWFRGMFEMRWFSFERLNFEIFDSPYDYCKNGIEIKKGDNVISVHIPSGSPLIYDECLKGYNAAAKFFKEKFKMSPVVFYCNSWLVFPDNKKVLNENSNILKFAADYDIIDLEFSKEGCDFSRIFGCGYSGDLGELPTNTSLQKNVVEFLKSGGRLGNGKGFFIYKKQ